MVVGGTSEVGERIESKNSAKSCKAEKAMSDFHLLTLLIGFEDYGMDMFYYHPIYQCK